VWSALQRLEYTNNVTGIRSGDIVLADDKAVFVLPAEADKVIKDARNTADREVFERQTG
jgi:regulator of RNase E activity RraA